MGFNLAFKGLNNILVKKEENKLSGMAFVYGGVARGFFWRANPVIYNGRSSNK
jgi:hypothetical protein